MKLKLTLIAALALLTCPVINCGVFSKFIGATKNSFRSSFAKPAMLRLFDPKSIVLDDKYKDNPGVKVSLALPKIVPYVRLATQNNTMTHDEAAQYYSVIELASSITNSECTGPVEHECNNALLYSSALAQASSFADAKKMAEEGFYEIFCTAMDHNDRNDQGLD